MTLKSVELEKELKYFNFVNNNKLSLSQLITIKNYIKSFKKIEEIKSKQFQIETVLSINELFFINELVSIDLFKRLQISTSKEEIKYTISYIKRETDIINAKIKLYKNNIYKYDEEEEIVATLNLYYDEFSAKRIMKEIKSEDKVKRNEQHNCKIIYFKKRAN